MVRNGLEVANVVILRPSLLFVNTALMFVVGGSVGRAGERRRVGYSMVTTARAKAPTRQVRACFRRDFKPARKNHRSVSKFVAPYVTTFLRRYPLAVVTIPTPHASAPRSDRRGLRLLLDNYVTGHDAFVPKSTPCFSIHSGSMSWPLHPWVRGHLGVGFVNSDWIE